MNINHDFNFDGGDILKNIGASWFVSYNYWWYIERSHLNWKNVKTYSSRMLMCDKSKKYHKYWLEQIVLMSDEKLSTNKIGVSGQAVKTMAALLLDKYNKIFGYTNIN